MIGSHTATPASYLRQFSRIQRDSDRKAKLWVYQRGAQPFSSTPTRVGRENGYFAVTTGDGSSDESMEIVLAQFDAEGAELLPLFGNEAFVASGHQIEIFTQYIALLFSRTTARRDLTTTIQGQIRAAYKDLAGDNSWLQHSVTLYQQHTGRIATTEDLSKAMERVVRKLANPEHVKNGFVVGLLRIAEGISRELNGKPWQIWEAPGGSQFVTTDNPVVTLKAVSQGGFTPGWGFRTPGMTTFFPICPRCCFVVGDGVGVGARYWRRATIRDVGGVNKAPVACMDRWAYSSTHSDDITWLVNHLGGSIRYGVNAFVPSWMNDPEDIKKKVRAAIAPQTNKIGPQAAATGINTKKLESN